MTIQTITAVFLLSNSTLDEIELNDEVITKSLVSGSENGCKSNAIEGASKFLLGETMYFCCISSRKD